MPAKLIDGKSLAAMVRAEQKDAIESLAARGVRPGPPAVLVGDDPASRVYVRNKARACNETGVRSEVHEFPEQVSESALLECVARLNADPRVHGILVQLPLTRPLRALSGKLWPLLLSKKNAPAPFCHTKPAYLAGVTRQADILVAAVGSAKLI